MKPVRVRTAVMTGAIATVALGVMFQLVINQGSNMPRHSWWEVALLLLVGAALLSSGWRIRRYVASLGDVGAEASADGEGSAPTPQPRAAVDMPSPESSRRTLVLAQALAVGGAALTGWYLAQLIVQLPRSSVSSVRQAVLLLAVLAVEGVGLSVAGYTVQRWCTLPEEQR